MRSPLRRRRRGGCLDMRLKSGFHVQEFGTSTVALDAFFRHHEWDPPSGAVAQLGARLNGIQEVRGSNPLSSTFFLETPGQNLLSGM